MTEKSRSKSQASHSPLDLSAHIPARLLVLSARIALHASRLSAKPNRLSIREWRIVQILGSQGPSTINDVAATVAMDFGGTSRAISALETRGFVARRADSEDRRVSFVNLTPQGETLFSEISAFALEREARLLSGLSASERSALQAILDKLEQQANDMLRETAGPISAKRP